MFLNIFVLPIYFLRACTMILLKLYSRQLLLNVYFVLHFTIYHVSISRRVHEFSIYSPQFPTAAKDANRIGTSKQMFQHNADKATFGFYILGLSNI